MCPHPCHGCIPMRQLSEEAAVEILNFLQVFTLDFEMRYADQIRRDDDERSRHNIVAHTPSAATDDPPF